jgi:catechol 2,3-dioxygenase-like lactoylglutathione lyase family enzyme
MPVYALNHLHHETKDVPGAVAFYQKVFGATADPPFERGGATWVAVRLGQLQITVTNRPAKDMELGRYQGLDHFALTTDDFDATLAAVKKNGIPLWTGPLTLDNGQRIAFVQGPDHLKIELMEKI